MMNQHDQLEWSEWSQTDLETYNFTWLLYYFYSPPINLFFKKPTGLLNLHCSLNLSLYWCVFNLCTFSVFLCLSLLLPQGILTLSSVNSLKYWWYRSEESLFCMLSHSINQIYCFRIIFVLSHFPNFWFFNEEIKLLEELAAFEFSISFSLPYSCEKVSFRGRHREICLG